MQRTLHDQTDSAHESGDLELLKQFKEEPRAAWRVFIDRYANLIFTVIRSLGFDYDESMDRFVYVCEKLSEKNYRRLREVKYAGSRGELTPWIRQVVKRLCVSWAWSLDGRKRLLKPISELPQFEQRVFELYFWQGLRPSEIEERLQQENFSDTDLTAVFVALDQIFSKVSQKKLWRLVSNLSRSRGVVSLDTIDDEDSRSLEPIQQELDPEVRMIQREQDRQLQNALLHLPEQQVLILQFRYEHALTIPELAEMLRLDEAEVKRELRSGLDRLRLLMKK